jgi:NAD(P)-dependent dehydrogenase (short-subunit alcohol dehydrogenase family)
MFVPSRAGVPYLQRAASDILVIVPVFTGAISRSSLGADTGMRRAKDLAGQVVVVTGAARGLGALVARRLAARDARVALLGLEPAELAKVSASCGPGSRWWAVDVTDDRALADVAAAVRDAYGRVDVVVANAGIAIGGPFIYSEARAFARVIEVNLLGSVATARAFLPALLESQGYLLQVASLAALTPAPMMAAYCASKSGVEAFAHAVRAEVAHHGVRVGVAYLSWTDTDMVRGADENAALREMRAGLPFPAGRTNPLEPTADALVRGITRRATRVYGQRWLPPVQLVRGILPLMVTRVGARAMPQIESRWLATGAATQPFGPGGAADTKARKESAPGTASPGVPVTTKET